MASPATSEPTTTPTNRSVIRGALVRLPGRAAASPPDAALDACAQQKRFAAVRDIARVRLAERPCGPDYARSQRREIGHASTRRYTRSTRLVASAPTPLGRAAFPDDIADAQLAGLSDEHHDLATFLYSDSHRLEADKEGRIVLPAELIAHAGLKPETAITFMGIGSTFEIWDVAAAERRKAEARERSAALRFNSPGVVPQGSTG